MRWEAIAINADFWSQVLQSRSLKPMDFALGAVMAIRRNPLAEIGGFEALADCLADDYQLGHRLVRRGYRIALCPIVVECWSAPLDWRAVWKHQLRWARTIRVCQPVPYFFSILSNATLWPLLLLAVKPPPLACAFALACCLVRILTALNLQQRLNHPLPLNLRSPETGRRFPLSPSEGERAGERGLLLPEGSGAQSASNGRGVLSPGGRASPVQPPHQAPQTPARAPLRYSWLIPLKDLLQAAIWLLAFLGNRVEWRGQQMRLRRDGTLERLKKPAS
jgi:hypothetical protein